MARRSLVALTVVGFTSYLFAGGFWERKPFESWSQQEVVRMLTRSPWSKVVVVPVSEQVVFPQRVQTGEGSPLSIPGSCEFNVNRNSRFQPTRSESRIFGIHETSEETQNRAFDGFG